MLRGSEIFCAFGSEFSSLSWNYEPGKDPTFYASSGVQLRWTKADPLVWCCGNPVHPFVWLKDGPVGEKCFLMSNSHHSSMYLPVGDSPGVPSELQPIGFNPWRKRCGNPHLSGNQFRERRPERWSFVFRSGSSGTVSRLRSIVVTAQAGRILWCFVVYFLREAQKIHNKTPQITHRLSSYQ